MPRKQKPPRLYLRTRADGGSNYIILDNGRQIATGCGAAERARAEAELHRYLCSGRSDASRNALGIIYFLTANAPDYPVKIGFTLGLGHIRMRSLQTACPYRLVKLGHVAGTVAQERAMQRDFEHLRLEGEWFLRDPALMNYIEMVCRAQIVSLPPATIGLEIQEQTGANVAA